jgi:photosystem II stability/assembly factor-like uncharacterized protein
MKANFKNMCWLVLSVLGLLVASGTTVRAAGVVDPLNRPAMVVTNPDKQVLLGVAAAGRRLVAVGERGLVIISDDGGQHWRQAKKVPTSISLTAVAFPTATDGWAVGHAGVVLHSEDGGETWQRQLDGVAAAQIALAAAQVFAKGAGVTEEQGQTALENARRFVDDGADKPFLSLAFEDEAHGFIVGAYGLIFRTTDGGKSWQSWIDRLENPLGLHIYAIQIVGKHIYLAGEQGLFLRSTDSGEHFTAPATPYDGSYFSLAAGGSGEVLLLGLRGNAFRSADHGTSFDKVSVPSPVSFTAAAQGQNGNLYFANQAGFLLTSPDYGQTMVPVEGAPRLPPISGLARVGAKKLISVGYGGAILVAVEPGIKTGAQP